MPAAITRVARALPITIALLGLAACSSAAGASSAPTHVASSDAPVRAATVSPIVAACQVEDAAYQKARPILNNSASARKAYASLKSYTDQIDAAQTDPILTSDVEKDLLAEYADVGLISVDQDESPSVTQQDLDTFATDHAKLVADCKAHGYVSTATQ